MPTTFDLKPGQWTRNTSTAPTASDSLPCCAGFSAVDIEHRLALWWWMGSCNPFGADTRRHSRVSLGLSGATSTALREPTETGNTFAQAPLGPLDAHLLHVDSASVVRTAAIAPYDCTDLEQTVDTSRRCRAS